MASFLANDLTSPVSLLWAHQLRREHAVIVAQLEDLKAVHPSASELKKSVTRTEKAEAATSKMRKELTELKSAHQRTVRVVEGLEKELRAKEKAWADDAPGREGREEAIRVEIERLSEMLMKQEGGLDGIAEEVQKTRQRAEEASAVMGQKLVQEDDEIRELRGLVQVLNRKIEDAVVVKDSVDGSKTNEAPAPPRADMSETESFDLDANMLTVTAAPPSGPSLGPSLAMIKESTLPRVSQRLRDQHQPSMGRESMEMLPEPSLPAHPQQPKCRALPEQGAKSDIDLVQGKSTLTAYIQVAGSQYQETLPGEEERFVTAFVDGLRDKRDRKKCEKKLKDVGKTWEGLLECFPIASQPSPVHEKGEDVRKKAGEVETGETGEIQDSDPAVMSAKKRKGIETREARDRPSAAPTATKGKKVQTKRRARSPSVAAPDPAQQIVQEAETRSAERARPLPTSAPAKKRNLAEHRYGRVENHGDEALHTAKKRRTKPVEKRQERRPPSIPILPSSDDEFSRGCRR